MSKHLEHLESRIQKLIEGAGKIFSPGKSIESFSEQIIQTMRENASVDPSGVLTAPESYLVEINSDNSHNWSFSQADLDQLISELTKAADENGILFSGKPEIIIRPNPNLTPGSIQISATRIMAAAGNTASVNISEDQPELNTSNTIPDGAFLIVNGKETVQLQKPVINIGRRTSNDIVLDDPRVSRAHAQLRAIKGTYVVFDLNSSGGTFVNSVPVTRKELAPGDVISMSGVAVIYGQEIGNPVFNPSEQTPTGQLLNLKPGEKK
jgi:hypothetical protein